MKPRENDLFGERIKTWSGSRDSYAANPGTGPKGMTCRDCKHFTVMHYSRTYFFCGLVRCGTIRARTPACMHFEEDQ